MGPFAPGTPDRFPKRPGEGSTGRLIISKRRLWSLTLSLLARVCVSPVTLSLPAAYPEPRLSRLGPHPTSAPSPSLLVGGGPPSGVFGGGGALPETTSGALARVQRRASRDFPRAAAGRALFGGLLAGTTPETQAGRSPPTSTPWWPRTVAPGLPMAPRRPLRTWLSGRPNGSELPGSRGPTQQRSDPGRGTRPGSAGAGARLTCQLAGHLVAVLSHGFHTPGPQVPLRSAAPPSRTPRC